MATPALNKEQVAAYARRFASTRVMVVGDVMLDRYFWGDVGRISPEAPVPVVKVDKRSARAGGAANVAANLSALGIRVDLLGVVGNDPAGEELRRILEESKINTRDIHIDSDRLTTEKVRIIARNQQVVRADFETNNTIPQHIIAHFLDAIERGSSSCHAIIVSDYGKGALQENYLRQTIELWRSKGKPVLIDPHVGHFQWYRRATILTPNSREATSFYGASLNAVHSLEEIGFRIKEALELEALLVTRGEEGMSLFIDEKKHVHIPTVAKEVYDVTGAGDTVISVLAAGLGVGANVVDAVVMANQAAGETVKEIGTASVTTERLISSFV